MTNPTGIDEDDVAEHAEKAGRAGLVVRGVLYLVSALLTIRIALGSAPSEEGPGKQGAIRSVAEQPFGRILVLGVAVGLAGYAIWRFIAAATYEADPDESDAKALAKRVGYVGRGVIYLAALGTALSLVIGGTKSDGGGSGDGQNTERVFDLPLGRWIVLAVGVGFLVAAAYNAYRAVTLKYREKWDDSFSPDERRLATIVSSAGLFGHMLVFALVGFFLTRAAIEYDPNEPEGLDQAVRSIADASWGTSVLLLLAVGMVAYAAFSFIEARWRRLLD